MIKTVLLDLDDTLLRVDTDAFARKYIAEVGIRTIKSYPAITPEIFQNAVRESMRATITHLDPSCLNNEKINAAFAHHLSLQVDEIVAVFNDYFDNGYSDLRGDADAADGAAELVATLLENGYNTVIATNPVFPARATHQRIRWAGFDPDKTKFKLITTLENMHFAKPTPHYYEEVLARIGVESEDAIMVGDDYKNDIAPAAAAGLATWWLSTSPDPNLPIQPDGVGLLRDFLNAVNSGWLQTLPPHPRMADQVFPRMLGNLAALDGLAREIDPLSWNVRPIPNEWTALEIVMHLEDSEGKIQRPRLERILNEDNPFLPPTPEPPRPGEWNTAGKDAMQVLANFRAERMRTLDLLRSLTPEQWARPARHSIFGPTTLLEMAHFTARHDRLHINQLCETVGACRE